MGGREPVRCPSILLLLLLLLGTDDGDGEDEEDDDDWHETMEMMANRKMARSFMVD